MSFMYPAQTSLIPVHIALARFLESQGWRAIFAHYPYWYLGTTPFRYLTGPILPNLLAITKKLLYILPLRESAFAHSRSVLSLFEVFWGWLGIFWVIGGIGVYWLVRELSITRPPRRRDFFGPAFAKATAGAAAVFYLFGPIVPFLFRFSDGLSLMAFSVLPWVWGGYARFLRSDRDKGDKGEKGIWGAWGLLGLTTLAVLLDASIIPTMILGMAAVFLATSGWKKAEEKIKQTFYVLLFTFLISTLWYSPGYWWQLLIAPSFAGKPLFRVIGLLGQLLPIALAVTLAAISGKFFKKFKLSAISYQLSAIKFCFYWLFIFGFLTLIRFISDPDFWLDWSAYGVEIQMGIGIGMGLILDGFLATLRTQKSLRTLKFSVAQRVFSLSVLLVFLFGIWLPIFNKYVLGTLQKDITQTVEYRIGSRLAEVARAGESPAESPDGDRGVKVFLSGTTVFWLNAFFDLPQVRGGVDQVSVDSDWREAAWEVRSFGSTQDEDGGQTTALKWLRELDVSYLVVHNKESEEYWHDFRHPEKFERVDELEKIYDEKGDRIYRFLE